MGRTCCVQKLFLTFRTISVHNMLSPCSSKRRASDKDLPVNHIGFTDVSLAVKTLIYLPLFILVWGTLIAGDINLSLNCSAGLRSLTIFSASCRTESPVN